MRDIRNHSLLHHNTFGIDVSCRRFIEFDTKAELLDALSGLTEADYPIMPLGKGSNLLLTKDFDGTVLSSNIRSIDLAINNQEAVNRSGSGVDWDDLVEA